MPFYLLRDVMITKTTIIYLFFISAVPLSNKHPHSLLLYYCNDTNSKLLITVPKYADLTHRVVKNTDTKLYILNDKLQQTATEVTPKNDNDLRAGLSADFYNKADAMILYTSGTTGNPKGTHLFFYTFFC